MPKPRHGYVGVFFACFPPPPLGQHSANTLPTLCQQLGAHCSRFKDAWPITFPTVLFVAPMVRRQVARLTTN